METKQTPPVKYQGLGGWLILVGIVIINSMFILLKDYVEYFGNLTSTLTMIYFAVDTLDLLLGIVTLYLFFKKSYRFPLVFIIFMLFPILTSLGLEPLRVLLEKGYEFGSGWTRSDIIIMLLPAMVWIPYILKSKRVKATFVLGRNARPYESN